jgi:hypothetical protein
MSTKTSFKRVALVAVAALGMGVLTSVSPANAAIAATVSPVRVSLTSTTLDNVPYAGLSWVAGNTVAATDTATLVLTTAPTSSAKVAIVGTPGAARGTTIGSVGSGIDSLADVATAVALTGNAGVSSGAAATIGIAADTPGYYAGTITIRASGVLKDEITFSFTTTGAVASYTVTASESTVSPSGASTLTITLLDAASKVTQPGSSDALAVTTTAGSLGSASISATNIYDGTADNVLTTSATAGASHTVTVTPQGTLGTLAAKTVTIANNSTVINVETGTGIAFTVTAPADAAAVAGTVSGDNRTQSVRTGSSAITVGVTSAKVSATIRLKIVANAGTVDGTVYTTPVYKNVTTDAAGAGSVSFVLGAGATITGKTVTVSQVTVANAAIDPDGASSATETKFVITQADAATSTSLTTASPAGAIVKKLAATTSVKVTVADQFDGGLGAGWTIRAYRGTKDAANLLDTKATNAAGEATVTVTPLATVVADGAETYVYTYQAPGGSESAAISNTTVVTYTTTGEISSLSVAISGTTGATTPVTDTTLAAAVTILPAIKVPTDGTANTASGDKIYTKASAAITGSTAAEVITLAANATADNSSVFTASEGAFLSTTSSTAWNLGVKTLEGADSANVYVFATKTGLHTITITSGGKTSTVQFWAYNLATDYYSVSATSENAKPNAGSNVVVTATVKDIFGNPLTEATSIFTAKASGKVRLAGQALSQAISTDTTGSALFSVIADSTSGAGTITIALTGTGAEAYAAGYIKPTGVTAAPVSTASVALTVGGSTTDLTALVNSLIKKINAMQSLLNKIQKRLGVK